MTKPRRASMADVARLAGVSPQTVSRVSQGQKYVSEEKRQRVQAAMQELEYRPNTAARAMKQGAFKIIGVYYHSLHEVGGRLALEAIATAAAEHGYGTALSPLAASGGRRGVLSVDAAIVIVFTSGQVASSRQLQLRVPTVVLGPPVASGVSSIDIDQAIGTRDAIEHLLSLGHQTVHHIAGPDFSFPAQRREQTWREVLSEAGRRVPEPTRGDWTPNSGYLAARELLAAEQPTAIFVANDQMALGAFRAILEAGLRVPQDISLVGFDDIDEAVAFPTPLTTVAQDWDRVGRKALEVALGMLADQPPSVLTMPTRLIVRDSTGPAPTPAAPSQ
ncbi:MAG: LacI family DNA-binding transcriptional regulator [Acidobacteriota bacterium]|nr:LacI family DNA-binding transcriptional regulator [Acidobacteriota bacterium]